MVLSLGQVVQISNMRGFIITYDRKFGANLTILGDAATSSQM